MLYISSTIRRSSSAMPPKVKKDLFSSSNTTHRPMTTSRVTPKRAPVCPGRDSQFTIRRNPNHSSDWWVHYVPPGGDPIPADDPHTELVELVNFLKEREGTGVGGKFSIN